MNLSFNPSRDNQSAQQHAGSGAGKSREDGVRKVEAGYELREPQAPYGVHFGVENGGLRLGNTYFWNDIA